MVDNLTEFVKEGSGAIASDESMLRITDTAHEAIYGSFRYAKPGIYSPYDWTGVIERPFEGMGRYITDDQYIQKYLGGSYIGMTNVLPYVLDPERISKVKFDYSVHLGPGETYSTAIERYYACMALKRYYNPNTYYSYIDTDIIDKCLMGEGIIQNFNRVGELDIKQKCFLYFIAPGWTIDINNIEFEEV